MSIYAIVGTGGYGREVLPLASAMLKARLLAGDQLVFVDVDPGCSEINGTKTLDQAAFLSLAETRNFVVAVANSKLREKITDEFVAAGCLPFTVVAESSENLGPSLIGEGSILSSHTVVTANVKIGRSFHGNIYSYVAHDCVIGDFVTFAPRVSCNGNIVVENHAYIGTGAVLRQGTADRPLTIGHGAVVGMGAVVTKDVAAGATVVGNPAREMPTGN